MRYKRSAMQGAAILFTIFSCFLATDLSAQSLWLGRNHANVVSVGALVPDFADDEVIDRSAIGYLLTLKLQLTDNIGFMTEGAVLRRDPAYRDTLLASAAGRSVDRFLIGNPYIGIELSSETSVFDSHGSRFLVEIGVRLPLASGDSTFLDGFARTMDFDHATMFRKDAFQLSGLVNYRHKTASGFTLRVRGGAVMLMETGSGFDFQQSEVSFIYSGLVGYESALFTVKAGATGSILLSEGNLKILQQSVTHHAGVALNLNIGRLSPGLQFGMPLSGDFFEELNYFLGAGLTYGF